MKEIKLSNNRGIVTVDNEDYEWLNKYKWQLNKAGNGYAMTHININSKQIRMGMHRLIMDCSNEMEVDHVDHNSLNNQKDNLRIVTKSQNAMNRFKIKNCSSKFKGVYWDKNNKKWMSRITNNKKHYYLGRFNLEKEAAIAYNNKAKELFGEYANLNGVS